MNYCIGGFFLVQSAKWESWMENKNPQTLLPNNLWTAGNICEIFPDEWIFDWSTEGKTKGSFYQNLFQLSSIDFEVLRIKYNELFLSNQFGFPNVFFGIEKAYEFHSEFLTHIPNLKLLSISLPVTYYENFIKIASQPNVAIGKTGVYRKLLQQETLNPLTGEQLGFDVLGYDGGLVSFVWSSFAPDFHKDLGINFNTYGFIEDYNQAIEAARYTEHREVDYIWSPWIVHEYPLSA